MSQNPSNNTSIILYNGNLELHLDNHSDTIWASQAQIAELFGVDRTVITKHIRNIFGSDELDRDVVCAKFAHTTPHGAISGKTQTKDVAYYNLDMILSIGYRVNSNVASGFRKWASARLKEYLIQGYSINQKRLQELQKTIELISLQSEKTDISLTETKGLLDIISEYTKSFILLHQFDSARLSTTGNENITYTIQYPEAKEAIQKLKGILIQKEEATELFGNEKDTQFTGILQSIIQTFDGQYLYATIEEQAAHLLYFIIKDHPFSDGNKRIGAFLFMWFLEKNHHRFQNNGTPKINESGLVALALLIASSPPSEKEILIKLIINLINN